VTSAGIIVLNNMLKVSMIYKISASILLLLIVSFGIYAQTWSSIESDHFVVRFTESLDSAEKIQKISENFYQKITTDLGYLPGRKIDLWFCESKDEFYRSVNAPIQDWAVGCAYPMQARIVILDPDFSENKQINLSRIVKHEIVHVVFGLYVGENDRNIPRWFNEGVAMYLSDDWSYGNYWTILTATLGNSLIPLYEISDEFPERTSRAQLAYAQSFSIVSFMIGRYGMDPFRECIRLLSKGRLFDEALAGATGVDSGWMESRWLKDLKKRYKWFSLISSWVIFWGLIVLIAFIAYSRLKIRNRRILKKWEEEEELYNFSDDYSDEESDSEDWSYKY